MRRLLAYAIASLLLASVAHAEARDVDATLLALFNKERELAFSNATLTNTGAGTGCINWNRYGGLNSQLCSQGYHSVWYVPNDSVITKVKVQVTLGATASTCQLVMTNFGGADVTEFAAMAYDQSADYTTYEFTPTAPFILSTGALIQFRIENGTGTCAQVQNAWVTVHVYGYPLYSIN